MPNIHHQVLIDAPEEKVYEAITSQEGLSAWWTRDTKAIAEVGTLSRFQFGPEYFKEMQITELIPSKLVAWLCTKGASEWVGTNFTFKLEGGNKETILNSHPEMGGQIQQIEGDEITLLVFQHENWKAYTPMFAECNYTWGLFMRSLKLFCETGKGLPWPEQHLVNV
ncbi:SRPBCC domain-containing protein [Dyadobacter sp. CY312]|uniref:SRPBCC family protein n=1 Tax=Dyadobacter sp. CY312 TaxID=2907303 RepID=UPI001F3A9841|nr:SRPBCC domain-containing protein [Dyadobacter sp. CY312]MCE7040781.1 SRPBCC domain-containing protein [Dyadobacter sp. CY312]